MPKSTAGILVYRLREGEPEVFLAHPGGPYWRKKDEGAWTLPKGEIEDGEDPLTAGRRELLEETGYEAEGPFLPLGTIRMKSGKQVHAWAAEGDLDPRSLVSNTFEIEWPPRSGKRASFPEIDRADFYSLDAARRKLHPAQLPFLDRLVEALSSVG